MSTDINAPMPGTIVKILVKEGEEIFDGQDVLMLEAMKMENPIPTTITGKVKEISVGVGDTVAAEQLLMVIE
ncbi:MAG: acetyl-CoA carboxylase biotin carboxyl carrier protein subunit [Desulfobacterales bacterium]|nr:acetyl-CoA carboxylase biotin carboxyl carrier protein subunit [Desulfobacterales bacterium]